MSTINQKEYLKKYLKIGAKTGEKKKKKKSEKTAGTRMKIIDDDVDTLLSQEIQDDIDAANEDAPQIVAVIDERPHSLIVDEKTNNTLWKPIGQASNNSEFQNFKIGSIKLNKNRDDSEKHRLLGTKSFSSSKRNDNLPSTSTSNNYNKLKDKHAVSKGNGNFPIKESTYSYNEKNYSPPRRDQDYSPQRKRDIDQSPKRREEDYSPPRKRKQSHSPVRKKDQDSSPRRKVNKDSDYSSPRRDDKDYSPPRKRNKSYSPRRKKDQDCSPQRKDNKDSEKDYSPPRRDNKDYSPPRKTDKDYSPPRKRDQDHSPLRKKDQDYSPQRKRDKDLSPLRKRDQDYSPQRKRDKDLSPLRKKDQDYSPQRKRDKDLSPPGKRDQDSSPQRKRDKDLSPLRGKHSPPKDKSRKKRSRWEKEDSPASKEPNKPETTMSGKKSGLQNAKNLVDEIARLQKEEDEMFQKMSSEMSGFNAAPVVRKRKPEEIVDPEKEAREKELKEKYHVWGKGVKQVEDESQRYAEQQKEMNKPLARYADDEDLERYLKEQEREGDPMLAYIRKKKKKVAVEHGIPEKPMYIGDFMPNRYAIRPGYRWDGVDRSNGYEKKWFETQNAKQAMQEEATKWSQEDM
ncbi:BUD13 homolog [Diabrotica virgifera virgifera]|uniref:BUD13 homolog n=1 Tax=Diabrotica virgifera virgifera TaxID=50390 RepID=A0A6P7GYW6_DIAVI|nr:BUD13 homolog [Diabrotica virgifera virgifera]